MLLNSINIVFLKKKHNEYFQFLCLVIKLIQYDNNSIWIFYLIINDYILIFNML